MKKTQNGVTIDTTIEYLNDGFIISDGTNEESYALSEWAFRLLDQFLSDPVPEVDTRKYHYETFDHVEDKRNARWFCKKCYSQFMTATFICEKYYCHKCGCRLEDIFKYKNRIYNEGKPCTNRIGKEKR